MAQGNIKLKYIYIYNQHTKDIYYIITRVCNVFSFLFIFIFGWFGCVISLLYIATVVDINIKIVMYGSRLELHRKYPQTVFHSFDVQT